ncbi:MAG: hypothetical protein H0V73_08135 [Chloroflexi bacterium]|nr:hypothetical protein [Chloroflexota bacterium]
MTNPTDARTQDDPGLDPDTSRWLELAEAWATRDVFEAAIVGMPGNPLGLATREIGGAVALALGAEENSFFNRTIALGIERPASEADLDQVVAFYAEHDRTLAVIAIAPQARPPELVGWVEARGFAVSRRWPKLWRTLDELPAAPPTDLRIEGIGAERGDDFAAVVNTAFEFDDRYRAMIPQTIGRAGWRHYLGFDGEAAVAAGALYTMGDVAWLGFGATLESHRGRGGQSAIFHRRLTDAREIGCRLATTETGPDSPEEPNHSFRNMIRLGFQVGYHRPNYVRRPAES